MRDYFADSASVDAIVGAGDREVYAFWEIEYQGLGNGLSYGMTTVQPGKVGREFHMTKGHYHTTEGDEIYICLEGQGVVILRNRAGDVKECEMRPGLLIYIDAGWGHRTVNTGTTPLVFVSVWAPGIEHDYETVRREGYPSILDAEE